MQGFEISVRADVKRVQKTLSALAYQQLPFATAEALTALAKLVQKEETKALSSTLDNPTPFTLKSIGVKAARKSTMQALVFVKDIAASYLEPYEFGGVHKLNSRALLNPKDIGTNQYGNIPKSALARLKGRSDVFIGTVKTKAGETINGVWQRPTVRVNQKIKGRSSVPRGANSTGRLKLLIRFGDALPVKKQLHYRDRARRTISANFNREFGKASAKALASAKV